MAIMPIPDDWMGEWECYVIEWPKSQQWESILLGFITTPLRGRYWDGRTGSIKDVQSIGREIEERNLDFMACQDIADNISLLVQVLQEVSISVENQVTVNQSLVNEIKNQNQVIALANATASSYSVSTAMLSLQNYLRVDIRPLGGNEAPPIESVEAERGGLTEAVVTEDRACDAAYWLVENLYQIIKSLQKYYVPGAFDIPNSILSTLSAAFTAASLRFPNYAPWLVPAAALSGLVAALQKLQADAITQPTLDALVAWMEADFDDIVCRMIELRSSSDTGIIQDEVIVLALSAGLPVAVTPLLRAWFNLNNLATLFYEPLEYIVPTRPIGYECCPTPEA